MLCERQNLKDNTVLHQKRCTKKDRPSVAFFLKKYNIRMKTLKRLNIQNKPGYSIMSITNINDFDPEFLFFNKFTIVDHLSNMFDVNYCQENNTPNVVFNKIECAFENSGVFKYLIF